MYKIYVIKEAQLSLLITHFSLSLSLSNEKHDVIILVARIKLQRGEKVRESSRKNKKKSITKMGY